MDSSERPKLPATVDKAIESSQIKIDKYFWQRLLKFQVSAAAAKVVRLGYPDLAPMPPEPKRPTALRSAIAKYALNLFAAEAARYPTDERLESHLAKLGERVVERVMGTVAALETAGQVTYRSLGYHGLTSDQMRGIATEEIGLLIEGRLVQVQPPKSVTVGIHPVSGESSEVERRANLLADYKAATGAKDYHIYNARNSGLHKPEFYQWRDGRLPSKSKVTKRFEVFLKARKRPIPRNPTN